MNISQDLTLLWNDIIHHPGTSIAIICNLIIIESLLSVDNAAVLATIVMDLPKPLYSHSPPSSPARPPQNDWQKLLQPHRGQWP
ncbi:hypothetical protein BW716_09430 [[Flexibacter] sp. ATCC 35208]|nr:hypothetical protein BW716_09430 [[Flexibacter] sp. ATCC 35208]